MKLPKSRSRTIVPSCSASVSARNPYACDAVLASIRTEIPQAGVGCAPMRRGGTARTIDGGRFPLIEED
jgi:hypothetical protein